MHTFPDRTLYTYSIPRTTYTCLVNMPRTSMIELTSRSDRARTRDTLSRSTHLRMYRGDMSDTPCSGSRAQRIRASMTRRSTRTRT